MNQPAQASLFRTRGDPPYLALWFSSCDAGVELIHALFWTSSGAERHFQVGVDGNWGKSLRALCICLLLARARIQSSGPVEAGRLVVARSTGPKNWIRCLGDSLQKESGWQSSIFGGHKAARRLIRVTGGRTSNLRKPSGVVTAWYYPATVPIAGVRVFAATSERLSEYVEVNERSRFETMAINVLSQVPEWRDATKTTGPPNSDHALPEPRKNQEPTGSKESTYRHIKVIHQYDIQDILGNRTAVLTAEQVEVLKQEITIGGSYWDAKPLELEAFYKYSQENDDSLEGLIPVVSRVEKPGKLYRWDTYHDPAIRRGEIVWFVTKFQLKDEFMSKICHDVFHCTEIFESFTWKIKFPARRPAKRWWVTAEYSGGHSTLESKMEPTHEIVWSKTQLPKGSLYFMNWEW